MRVGDIIVNPHVNEYFKTKPNPMCKSIIIHIDPEYTTTLRYDGKTSLYFTSDVKEWKVLRNIDLCEIIFNTNDTNAFFNFDRVIEIEKKKGYNQALEDFYNGLADELLWIRESFGDDVYMEVRRSVGCLQNKLTK